MNIYLLTQNDAKGWNTYDSCVVVAANEQEARNIHPYSHSVFCHPNIDLWCADSHRTWASSPDLVTVIRIGIASEDQVAGVVCASFNAG